MIWSFSNHKMFRKCQRQWYFKTVVANARAKAELRHKAYRLSKLVGLYAWRGKIVDYVISSMAIPALRRGLSVSSDEAISFARKIFDQQRKAGTEESIYLSEDTGQHDMDFFGFLEVVHDATITDEAFDKAWYEIEISLKNFCVNGNLREILTSATALFAQRALIFKHNDVSVRAVPDLLVFYREKSPLIIDWKVQYNPQQDHWLQLATYSIALCRCNPHVDWPKNGNTALPPDINLVEMQLLTDEVRSHFVSSEDEADVDEIISSSAIEMMLACNDIDKKGYHPEEFRVTLNPNNCQVCQFKTICWEERR